jgi:hypothetical protein
LFEDIFSVLTYCYLQSILETLLILDSLRNNEITRNIFFKETFIEYRVALGQWRYLRSSDGSNRAFQFGTSTDKPLQGDYTGDGKADLAFFRPTTGECFVLRSEDSTFYGFPFGASGDYDGDGKFDAAVFRPTNTTWYLNRSTSRVGIIGFGANGDQPVPNSFVP